MNINKSNHKAPKGWKLLGEEGPSLIYDKDGRELKYVSIIPPTSKLKDLIAGKK